MLTYHNWAGVGSHGCICKLTGSCQLLCSGRKREGERNGGRERGGGEGERGEGRERGMEGEREGEGMEGDVFVIQC